MDRQSAQKRGEGVGLTQHGLAVEARADEIIQCLDVVGFEGFPRGAELVSLLAESRPSTASSSILRLMSARMLRSCFACGTKEPASWEYVASKVAVSKSDTLCTPPFLLTSLLGTSVQPMDPFWSRLISLTKDRPIDSGRYSQRSCVLSRMVSAAPFFDQGDLELYLYGILCQR